MTKAQLNELSLQDLMELNRNVVDIIKLKRMVNNRLNADVIQKGMIVVYKGSSSKLQSNEKFEVNKVNKTKATCTSLLTNKIWDLYLANIEPCQKSVINEAFINEE